MISSLRIHTNEIGADGVAVRVDLESSWFGTHLGDAEVGLSKGDDAAAVVAARLSRSGRDVVVCGTIKADVHVPCARCLCDAEVRIDAKLSLLLEPASRSRLNRASGAQGGSKGERTAREGEYVFSAAEADLDIYDGETVALDGFVREAILLEIPNFVLCSESCTGISLAPGGNALGALANPSSAATSADIDPRLAPLGAFLEKEEGGTFTAADLVAAAAARSSALSGKPKTKLKSSSSQRAVRIGKQRATQPTNSKPQSGDH